MEKPPEHPRYPTGGDHNRPKPELAAVTSEHLGDGYEATTDADISDVETCLQHLGRRLELINSAPTEPAFLRQVSGQLELTLSYAAWLNPDERTVLLQRSGLGGHYPATESSISHLSGAEQEAAYQRALEKFVPFQKVIDSRRFT